MTEIKEKELDLKLGLTEEQANWLHELMRNIAQMEENHSPKAPNWVQTDFNNAKIFIHLIESAQKGSST